MCRESGTEEFIHSSLVIVSWTRYLVATRHVKSDCGCLFTCPSDGDDVESLLKTSKGLADNLSMSCTWGWRVASQQTKRLTLTFCGRSAVRVNETIITSMDDRQERPPYPSPPDAHRFWRLCTLLPHRRNSESMIIACMVCYHSYWDKPSHRTPVVPAADSNPASESHVPGSQWLAG